MNSEEDQNSRKVTSDRRGSEVQENYSISGSSTLEANSTLEMSAAIKDTSNLVLALIKKMKVLQLHVKDLDERIKKIENS